MFETFGSKIQIEFNFWTKKIDLWPTVQHLPEFVGVLFQFMGIYMLARNHSFKWNLTNVKSSSKSLLVQKSKRR